MRRSQNAGKKPGGHFYGAFNFYGLCKQSKVSPEDEKTAIESAQNWCALLDTGDYGQSWEQAADFFKKAITKEKWDTTIASVRVKLGKIIKREIKTTTYKEQLPGVPQGMYYVLIFNTDFENGKNVTETVAMIKDEKGTWKSGGYFIK